MVAADLEAHRFTSANAREMGKRSAAARAAKREAERLSSVEGLDKLRALAATVERVELGPMAVAAAIDLIGRVTRGEQRVSDPAAWLRALVDVARLEAGEPTSASVVAHVGRDAVAAVVAAREEARRALVSPAAQAVGDAAELPDPVGLVLDVDAVAVEHEHGAPAAGAGDIVADREHGADGGGRRGDPR